MIHHLIRKVVPTFRGDGLYHPQNPNMGGGVERANRTFREDFYDEPKILAGSIGALRFEPTKSRPNLQRISPPPCIGRAHPNGVSTNQSDKGRMSLKTSELIQVKCLLDRRWFGCYENTWYPYIANIK